MTTPKERPILFSGEMVKAILAGRKTQTRRVIKPQPDESVTDLVPRATYAGNILWSNALWTTEKYGRLVELANRKCPYGKVGDRLWVRETWAHDCEHCRDVHCGIRDHIWYRANEVPMVAESFAGDARWRPSIFMPRWASRLTLEVTGVKVERVRDITHDDMIAEGIGVHKFARGVLCNDWHPQRAFHDLWDSINAKRGYSWESNPWVWAIEFKRVA